MQTTLFNGNQDSLTLHLRITKKCNADCSYCSSFEDKFAKPMTLQDLEISLDFIKKLILEKGLGGKRKYLTVQYVGGEVLVVSSDYLKEFTSIVKNKFTDIFEQVSDGVQSNLIGSKEKVENLFEIFDGNVGTSFDNHTTQRTIKKNDQAYKKIFFQNFSNVKRKFGVNLPGIIVIDKKMYPHAEAEMNIANKNKSSLTLRPAFNGGSPIESISEKELSQLYDQLFDTWFLKQDIMVEPFFSLLQKRINSKKNEIKKLISISGCPFQHNCATSSINLEPDGTLYVCLDMADSKNYPIGNAIKNELNEEVFNLLLERSKKLSNDCVKCDYFNECQGGCMNEAIEHTGDVFGKTHYCGTWKTVFGKIDNAIQTHGISNIEKWIERITP